MSTRLVAFYLLLVALIKKTHRTVLPARSVPPTLRELAPIPGIDGTSEQILREPVKAITLAQTGPTIELFRPNTRIRPR
jgi:hypothetical protein